MQPADILVRALDISVGKGGGGGGGVREHQVSYSQMMGLDID